jgi:cell division protein FtsN
VTALEAATGWLLVAGVLIAVFGAAVIVTARAAATRPAVPAGPATPPAEPAAPESRWSRT